MAADRCGASASSASTCTLPLGLSPLAGRSRSWTTPASARSRPSGRGWNHMEGRMDAIYFTAGDEAALRAARARARVLVASPRTGAALGQGIPLDALVLSG